MEIRFAHAKTVTLATTKVSTQNPVLTRHTDGEDSSPRIVIWRAVNGTTRAVLDVKRTQARSADCKRFTPIRKHFIYPYQEASKVCADGCVMADPTRNISLSNADPSNKWACNCVGEWERRKVANPRCPIHGDLVTVVEENNRLRAAIEDIDAHATPLGTDEDGFVSTGYLISVGCLHRALGIARSS